MPVKRHQAGRSSTTELSVDRISSRLAGGQGINMLTNQQQQTIATVQVPPVKTVRRLIRVRLRIGIHISYPASLSLWERVRVRASLKGSR